MDGDYNIEGGYKAVQHLFGLERFPTAIIAINDTAAIGMIKALEERGIRIPEDVSLAGYDNTHFSEIASPPLTSISYNLSKYAEVIMKTIMDIIHDNNTEKTKYIKTDLVIRNSCSAINSRL